MATLVIKLNAKHGRFAEFVKFNGNKVSIGRGLNNDVVLSDSYVDAEQILLLRQGESWKIKLVGRTNPVLINGKELCDEESAIACDDELIIGRTHLTILSEDKSVAATRKLRISNWFSRDNYGPIIPLTLVILVALAQMFYDYLGVTTEIKWGVLASSALGVVLVIVCWAGIWALVGRLLRHQPHFCTQLFYTAFVVGVLVVGSSIGEYAEYMSNSSAFGEIVLWIFSFILGIVLLRFNLIHATNVHNITMVSIVVNGCLLLFIFSLEQFNEEDFQHSPQYSGVVKPPFSQTLSSETEAGFAMEYKAQFKNLTTE